MEIAVIGMGRMGANIARRLARGGHRVVVFNRSVEKAFELAKEDLRIEAVTSLAEIAKKLKPPRRAWVMVPAGAATDETIAELLGILSPGDVIIDGGNSNFRDSMRRAAEIKNKGFHFVDSGTSGGIWGLTEGYSIMVGGEKPVVEGLRPVFETLAPAPDRGWGHVGPAGAGHFVKMVHNGIEYGIMAAYAEGLNILMHANVGKQGRAVDAETAPLRNPEHYQYDLNLPDIAEVWRRGSVIASWLLDLTAAALWKSPDLAGFSGRVSDSGEGRWTLTAAIDEGAPASVLSAALYQRFASRGEDEFAARLLSAMRFEFGGHVERKTGG
ncbi:MAG: phosphogluconate dehydrogenase (NAD(+)-dependent, decarboxylating) [Acidobacteriota bacterium]